MSVENRPDENVPAEAQEEMPEGVSLEETTPSETQEPSQDEANTPAGTPDELLDAVALAETLEELQELAAIDDLPSSAEAVSAPATEPESAPSDTQDETVATTDAPSEAEPTSSEPPAEVTPAVEPTNVAEQADEPAKEVETTSEAKQTTDTQPAPTAEAKASDSEQTATPAETKEEPKQTEQKPKRRARNKVSLAQVTANFAGCGRCGYFFVDYGHLHGQEHVKQIVAESDGRWLLLQWSPEMRRLIQASFGHRLDANSTHFEGQCMICRRRYGFREDPAGEVSFRVQIKKR